MTPVAIVGGRGYLGRHLAAHLAALGWPLWLVGRQAAAAGSGEEHAYRSASPDLEQAVAGARTVVHLATLSTPATGDLNPQLDVENVRFTVELIVACAAQGVRHIVFASSGGAVYGDTGGKLATEDTPTHPICSYAIGKLASERYLAWAADRKGLAATVLRVSNPYGGTQVTKGDQGVVSYLAARMRSGTPAVLLGNTIRDYVWIEDVNAAFEKAVAQPEPRGFKIYNIATGRPTSLSDLATAIGRILGVEPALEVASRRPFDLEYNVLDPSRARRDLGWRAAVDLEDGLERQLLAR